MELKVNSKIIDDMVLIQEEGDRYSWIHVYLHDNHIASIQYDIKNEKIVNVEIETPTTEALDAIKTILCNDEKLKKWILY